MPNVDSSEAPAGDPGTSLTEQMRWLHARVRHHHPQVHRIAIALYDSRHDTLKTYVDSSDVADRLALYERPLADVPSLFELAHNHSARVIDDMVKLQPPHGEHTLWLLAHGYRSSYTVPLYLSAKLLGFLFFDSRRQGLFDSRLLHELQIYVQWCRLSVFNMFNLSLAVAGLATSAGARAHLRDIETGRHLDRMSSYSRLIAKAVAPQFGRDDEFIEHVYLFSPLHDVGKVGVADNLLLKPGRLTDEQRLAMQEHVALGERLIEEMMLEGGIVSTPYFQVLKNIVRFHHEFLDGSGYPQHVAGDAVPLEARIVATADIFDALTSIRPYRTPCSNDEALLELKRMADAGQIDPRCVSALARSRGSVTSIQQKFGLTA
ncbi:HD domain-containing protein [Methyloversatilis sp. XJ19-13]|uniref:HD-GYP domain-containing protein n=1 Tax=Methyloversatilis sp. XJ19-13 TaxID=2963430 RepID=UPI00211D11E3|nr:HD domain-containing phosphohydrolase [Methyloversatilis sp. XJ19-13]MCQ9375987.1 HD domain-containing protein [Methyloversatilis sp. XJ19-13]